jgi:hypothetical protein
MPADSASERVTRRQRIVAVVGTALLITVLAGCSDEGDGPGGTAAPTPTPVPSTSVPVLDHDDSHQNIVPPLASATDVVTRFAAIWVNTGLPEREWWASLEPLCERGFALRIQRSGRPAMTTKLTIRGAPRVLVPPSPAPGKPGPEFGVRAVYQVPVDRGVFTVTVEAVGKDWLVFAVDHKQQVTT